eukprot:gene23237-biopygen15326
MDAQLVASKAFERDETTVVLKDLESAALMVFLKAVIAKDNLLDFPTGEMMADEKDNETGFYLADGTVVKKDFRSAIAMAFVKVGRSEGTSDKFEVVETVDKLVVYWAYKLAA